MKKPYETPEDKFCYTEDMKTFISDIVNQTVLKLKMAGLMKDDRKSAYQKTEELLRNYNAFAHSDQPYTKKLVRRIDDALERIQNDDYIDLIVMHYFEGKSREEIAEFYDVTVTTVSRNKTRLIETLKTYLFSDDVIYELFL